MTRVGILIDGQNLHHIALKKIRVDELSFDFDSFISHLADSREIVSKSYYTGTVRQIEGDEKNAEVVSKQTSFLTSLWKTGRRVETSKLRRRDETLTIDSRVEEHRALKMYGFKEIRYSRDREKGST